jgi:hypothetical protein
MSGNVWIKSGVATDILPVLSPLTGIATGAAAFKPSPFTTFQAIINGTGAITATVIIDCSNDGVSWCVTPLGTITLTGTTNTSDGFTVTAPWKYVRARITAVSGTISSIFVKMGV